MTHLQILQYSWPSSNVDFLCDFFLLCFFNFLWWPPPDVDPVRCLLWRMKCPGLVLEKQLYHWSWMVIHAWLVIFHAVLVILVHFVFLTLLGLVAGFVTVPLARMTCCPWSVLSCMPSWGRDTLGSVSSFAAWRMLRTPGISHRKSCSSSAR